MNTSPSLDEYIARIEEACGEEKNIIVHFKYDKKDEATTRILKKARVEKTIAGIIFDLKYENISFRLYMTGKAIFKNLKGRSEAQKVLAELLL
jgi:hypothetical protein